jgi:signal transduction histidine kinase
MIISVKSKILLTVLSVVLMFALFILFYFPARQERLLIDNYNNEIDNFAKSVALGVKIALTEQNFEGVETAIDFVRHDDRLQFVSLLQRDTIWSTGKNGDYNIGLSVLKTFPDSVKVDTEAGSDEDRIVKSAPFVTPNMSGEVMLSFSTREIIESKKQIRLTSLIASSIVFAIGLAIGYWLARNISRPVLALRDAANKVGEGDLAQSVTLRSKDEVGELGLAFNKMVKDLNVKAALERVRNEITGMRSKEDLPKITPIIWKELQSVGVPFNRCGVLIIDQEAEAIESYLSTPGGEFLGVFKLPFKTHEIAVKLVSHWQSGQIYYEQWNKDQFLAWMNTMIDQGHIESNKTSKLGLDPPESLSMHFVPFNQGMLYVGNDAELSDYEVGQVKLLADAFAIAYARYQDFKSLEDAKNKTEQTLDELKSAQTQLIQSEKMASLGELTAGIAHEIQNPLNFVNNFAEVSVDLLEELDEEMANENVEDVEAIKDDLKQNLTKINHHGKRASSIVRGMLEHSRTSDQNKELTDINALIEEYLRLAYHGLRAKNQSFNADYELVADDGLPKINVISQDLGRVILNMINNAFYAIAVKAKEGHEGYLPKLVVRTKKIEAGVEIRLEDNGSGIPEKLLDKIFQPFFTTKPTGEGTGLGLSLSYDIITKGHGGDLKVSSEQGIGTRFTITLPK